jgi:DNA-binding LacI/PurR family transcriptional regulator
MMVTGYDNSPLRRLSRPLLTTISMPFEELARRAAIGLQAQIIENAEPEPLSRVAGELLVGEST